MPVIYELRGRWLTFGELGVNLFSGCAVACRYCSDYWVRRMTWEKWTRGAGRAGIFCSFSARREKNAGRSAQIAFSPTGDPYQSDEAARLTRKALLILEQYHLRVQMVTLCGLRSVRGFRHFGAQSLEIRHADSLSIGKLREEWEPGAAPIAERIQTLREAHAAGISTWVKIHPAAYPAELIDLIESLRADVDAWKIGDPPPGEPPPKAIVGRRPLFVDAETALAYLRRMVERGLSEKLRPRDEMKIWFPGEKDAGKSGEPGKHEG